MPHSYALDPSEVWFGDNLEKLNSFIHTHGSLSPSYDPHHKPVAAFDWDNTMIKNDIGEATLFWMVANGKIKRPKSWPDMNPWLTQDAIEELHKNCAGTSELLPTKTQAACADTLLTIYNEENLSNGKTPWKASPDPDRILPSYAFYAQLFQGYSPQELRSFTQKALEWNLKNKIDTKQKIGSKEYIAYIRIYTPMKILVSNLQKHGFDVWIISASIQPTVEVAAQKVGIKKDHVIGVRQILDKKGELTDSFESCGPYPDGNKDIWSYRMGKRCWLNKIVFNIKDPKRMMEPTPITFAAGDSDGDFFFLKDATVLRLVIDRNKPELMCHSHENSDGKWLINPMFIHPKSKKTLEEYNCSSFLN
ncbi:MAG: hypothetical protein A3D19_01755 [Deltaproteobacteria bacterium RIFCSPHIGHO2_02_FULL_38_15]|nr:MAG: hypothetical protein A3D19_01755 [Deltaproteobacteria bacterium RIFCSPHIGHO2_02_FULL_38_15]